MQGVWYDGKFVLLTTLEERKRKLAAGIKAVAALIDNSAGVDGLHLNGDLATWGELRTGGRFEEWLREFDEALKIATLGE